VKVDVDLGEVATPETAEDLIRVLMWKMWSDEIAELIERAIQDAEDDRRLDAWCRRRLEKR
jgi:hypothetical protein